MIRTKQDMKNYMHQDALANGFIGKRYTSLRGGVMYMLNPNYRFFTLLRQCEYYKNNEGIFNHIVYKIKHFLLRRVSMKLGFTIEPNCFGPGLSIPHYGTIIVNPNARIGANCRLHCCTNIGASAGKKEAPQLGDNVYIGPGAILFGNIQIGSNITIGANVTVNKSFHEEFVAIGGTPAKVIKKGMPNWIQFNGLDV